MTTNIYRFYWDCGRQGDLQGVFAATPEQIEKLIGQHVNFGEVLGKHSEVHGTIDEDDIELATSDQDFVKRAIEYGLVPNGHNPLDYFEETEEDEEDEEEEYENC